MQNKSLFQSPFNNKSAKAKQLMLKHQMPDKQISLFLDQAIENHYDVTIQLNPSDRFDRYIEMSGFLYIVGQQNQLVLQSEDGVLSFFVKPEFIRHIVRNS